MPQATVTDTSEAVDITGRLARWRDGDREARDQLFDLVQPQLRQLAARLLQRERPDHTLEPNAVVNELCLRLIGSERLSYQDRAHFFAVAAQTMRRILIDHARARVAAKRGGKQRRVALSDIEGWGTLPPSDELLDLHTLLSALETVDHRAARVVELRFFGGMQEGEIAEALGVSVITVKRDWKAARAWLAARLQ